MAAPEIWDLLEDTAYLGVNDVAAERSLLPNWPFEEYVYIHNDPVENLCQHQDEATMEGSADPCAEIGSVTLSDPVASPRRSNETFDELFEDAEEYAIGAVDDEAGDGQDTDHGSRDRLPMEEPQPDRTATHLEATKSVEPLQGRYILDEKDPRSIEDNQPGISEHEAQPEHPTKTLPLPHPKDKRIPIPHLEDPFHRPKQTKPQDQPSFLPQPPTRRLQIHSHAPLYLPAATKAYNKTYASELHRQTRLLTAYIHAHPSSSSKSKTLCISEAQSLLLQIHSSYEIRLRSLCPLIPYKPRTSFPDIRATLQETLALIIAFQNSPKEMLSSAQRKVYDACVYVEMMRWETELMGEMTGHCDRERMKRIQKTGIRYRMRDGLYLDLVGLTSFEMGDKSTDK